MNDNLYTSNMTRHSKNLRLIGVMAAATAAALAFNLPAQAEPLAYPGSSWGVLTVPTGIHNQGEEHNPQFTGKIEQGIDWLKFGGGKWTLNTYASLSGALDHQGLDWNNKVQPAVGVKVTRAFDKGVIDLGVQAYQERRWKSDTNTSGVQLYASYWTGWNLK